MDTPSTELFQSFWPLEMISLIYSTHLVVRIVFKPRNRNYSTGVLSKGPLRGLCSWGGLSRAFAKPLYRAFTVKKGRYWEEQSIVFPRYHIDQVVLSCFRRKTTPGNLIFPLVLRLHLDYPMKAVLIQRVQPLTHGGMDRSQKVHIWGLQPTLFLSASWQPLLTTKFHSWSQLITVEPPRASF